MRNKALLLIAAALLLAVGTVTAGSNMGFKITIPLTAGWANYVSLPYFNSYTDAASLFNDIPNCAAVKRWDNATGSYQAWNGVRGNDFPIVEGEGYIINVSTNSIWIVVGSHDPAFQQPLTAGWANIVSIPYNTTAATVSDLFNQVPNCAAIKRWDNASGSYQAWNGVRGINFNITPGEALIINVSTASTWQPAHY